MQGWDAHRENLAKRATSAGTIARMVAIHYKTPLISFQPGCAPWKLVYPLILLRSKWASDRQTDRHKLTSISFSLILNSNWTSRIRAIAFLCLSYKQTGVTNKQSVIQYINTTSLFVYLEIPAAQFRQILPLQIQFLSHLLFHVAMEFSLDSKQTWLGRATRNRDLEGVTRIVRLTSNNDKQQ